MNLHAHPQNPLQPNPVLWHLWDCNRELTKRGHCNEILKPTGNPLTAPAVQSNTLEYLDAPQLANRLNLPEVWVREQVRSRAKDPIPHVKFGRYVRFQWNSPELNEWLERQKKNGRG